MFAPNKADYNCMLKSKTCLFFMETKSLFLTAQASVVSPQLTPVHDDQHNEDIK